MKIPAAGCAALLLVLSGLAGTPRAEEKEAPDSLAKLAASVDRLAGLLEQEMRSRVEEKESQRIQVILGVLAVRYRKIDDIESEIRGVESEEDMTREQLALLKSEVDRLEKEARAQDAGPGSDVATEKGSMEIRLKLREERAAKLVERKGLLQNDLAQERRRLVNIEAILEAWMEKQR
jgi:hypothetical protein